MKRIYLFILVLISLSAGAQTVPSYFAPIASPYDYKWMKTRYFEMPGDTVNQAGTTTPVAIKGGKIYQKGTFGWSEVAGGSTYTFTGPLSESGGTVSITQANGSTNGYLSAVDWTLFNGKVSQDALDDTAAALRALIAAATPDSFTYATRRYVDSSVSALPTIYTANGTLSGNRTVTMGSYGLNFYKDASNYTNLTGAAFDARRGNVYTYFENGFGQMRIRTSGFEYNAWNNVYSNNDSSFTAGIYSSNEKTYNWKQAQFEANWQDGAAWKVAAYWKTNSTLSGMKGWTMRHTSTDGQAEIHTDRETFTVGSSTDSALVRKSDGTIGLYPVGGGGGSSISDGDKGDITVSSSGTVWTVDKPTLSTLTYGATTTWDYSTQGTAAKVTLTGNTTLSITNLPASVTYLTLEVVQDATGSRTITLPAGTKVIGGGAGAVTLTTTGGATDILTFYYNGTTLYCNIGTNYN